MGEAWMKLNEVDYAIAVPLDESSQPRVDETFPLHIYFPTEEQPGLHVAIHAEWALSMDRRQLAATPEALAYNQMLLGRVASFVATDVAVDLVRRCEGSAEAVQALVPALTGVAPGAGAKLRQLWSEALKETCFLPCADGFLQMPTDVRMLPTRLPSSADARRLAALDESRTLRADIEDLASVREFLSFASAAGQMSVAEFLGHLRPPTRDIIGAYYAFLVRWRDSIGQPLVAELKWTPSILTTNGSLLTPERDTVFFPRVRGDSSIPDDIPVPIAEVPDIEGVEGFLKDLGVRSFEWRDLIRDFLIKILANPEADPDERARALAGVRAYHRVRLSGSEDLAPVLARVQLPARTADGTQRHLRAGAEIYFGAEWTGSDELEIIYGPFGQAEFLDVEIPRDADQKQIDLDFYRMLGVEDHPRLDAVQPETTYGYMIGSARHPHRGPLFDEWMNQPDVSETARCPQGHPQSQQLWLSVRLDRHLELVETHDPRRLIAFWNQLALRWGSVYEPAMEAVFRCVPGSHSGDRNRSCESLFAYTLRSRPWVPVARGRIAEVVRPEDAWIDAAETPRRIKERIPRISEVMYQTRGAAGLASTLHLTDAGHPKVEDLLQLLDAIADEGEADGTNREIELAARWVQRTLDDVLVDEPKPYTEPEQVRLLASYRGTSTFVTQPPFADDPLLRDTWEKQRPVLAAETGLNKLTSFLSLTRLDDAVKTSALPYGDHLDNGVFYAVRRKIDGIKPYLFALVRVENSRAESRVRPALRRLELIVCDELILHYEYDGIELDRDNAVCYIASRQEKSGRRTFNVGTAYLELDPATGQPHWFPLGRQLAQHLGVPTLADAFTMLLTVPEDDRDRMMVDRQIQSPDITEAREQLRLTSEDDEDFANVLDSLMPREASKDQPSTAPTQADPGTAATPSPAPESSGDHRPSPPTAATSATPQPSAPPPVDYSAVQITDAVPGRLASAMPKNYQPSTGGYGYSTAPSFQTGEENRRVGKRGEEIVYNAERERLRSLGKNPDSVVWISRTDELSPFDITSVDADDQRIYIEVKSTKGADPDEAFYISNAELIEATFQRSRYYIYRVTNVDTATPTITRAADPLRLVKEGKGSLLLAKAHMTLTFDSNARQGAGDAVREDPGDGVTVT